MQLYKSAHTVYKTQYHIVWVTKYRRKILNRGVQEYLRSKFLEVRKYFEDWEYKEIGMEDDHVHIHMVIPPKYAVSEVVETIKKNTSRKLREKFAFLKEVYLGTESIWSPGFFVSTVGINEAVIKKYVVMQGKEDAGQAKLEF